ncbi:MAG: molybdopterin-binding protein, partial [Planctomycetota bacterium]
MHAEVIAIGDELSSGQRLDTNSQWLSQRLGELGFNTEYHTTVGDDLAANIRVLRAAADRADVIAVTGGLGPTLDDLTRQALADAFNRPLELHAASLRRLEVFFEQRKREMPERNRAQAMFPRGAEVIKNPHGTAPGIDLAVENSSGRKARFFALPGVPAEMKEMWRQTVAKRLEEQLGHEQGTLRYHAIKMFGVGESEVEVRLPTVTERDRVPAVGITVSRATITLRIAGRAKSEEDFDSLIAPTIEEINAAMGDLIFGTGNEELQHCVVKCLRESGKRMATLEIGHGAHLAAWLLTADSTAADSGNASDAAELNTVSAGNLAFPSSLSASSWLPKGHSLDPESDVSLANAVKQLALKQDCEIALLLGTYPSTGAMEQSQTTFPLFFAVCHEGQSQIVRLSMGGHPDVLGPRIAKTGLDCVRR